ncbi:MAG: FKBP-type peptidyl-prolyl cis-trans isomerase N-terminal domain-containing protein, partial [Bacteroidales bacterium]|nr:FKBP-type peptidyl-prolyl cis-trans isomerase N-terminal domain-containing protein [Bacteroidales bacterium]
MKLTNDKEKVSYIIGEDIGFSFQREGYDLDIDIMLEAIKGAATGKSENLLSETEKNEVMMRWQQEMQAKKQAQMAEQAKAAKKD